MSEDVQIGAIDGHLMFRIGSSSISCTCIGEPYASYIAERLSFEREAGRREVLNFAKRNGFTVLVEVYEHALVYPDRSLP